MDYKLRPVPLSSIRTTDVTYRITTGKNETELANAIKSAGVIVPPLLSQQSGRFIIISGFRRIGACSRIGLTEIEARLLKPETTVADCVKIAIMENAMQRPLNLIEQSRALTMLVDVADISGERLGIEAVKLGLPGNMELITKLLPLCRLPLELQASIISGRIQLAMASALSRLDIDACRALTEFFVRLGPGLNIQREILTHATEIAARDTLTVADIFSEEGLLEILRTEDLNRNQKINKVRDYLFRKRFPHIWRAEKRFHENVKRLDLGGEIRLMPPKHFESGSYLLKMNFRTQAELKRHCDKLEAMISHPALLEILA